MLNEVTLANGSAVTWEEFSKWSAQKQKLSLIPPNKGRIWGAEFGKKVSNSRRKAREEGVIYNVAKGENHVHSRKVLTPKGIFVSIKEAGGAYGVRGATIRDWIQSGKEGFEFLTPPKVRMAPRKKGGASGHKNGSARAVITPEGRFETLKMAAEHHRVSKAKISNLIKKDSENYKYEKELDKPRVFKNLNLKCIKTPDGIFNGLQDAAKFYGVCSESIRQRISKMKWEGWEYLL
jgi:hypothetical protein